MSWNYINFVLESQQNGILVSELIGWLAADGIVYGFSLYFQKFLNSIYHQNFACRTMPTN